MSSNNDQPKKPKVPPPSFHGVPSPPINVSTRRNDNIGEEVTRRVGVAAAPRFDNRHFEPIQMAAPPSLRLNPTMNVAPNKPQYMNARPQIRLKPAPLPRTGGWMLTHAPKLPEFHPLERTAVFVPHATAALVAGRVSDVLRERSIEATYDNSKAKAKCMTADQVDFRIRLYLGRSQFSHGIIVEVQRRFGSSLNFHSDTRAILDAAEGKPTIAPSTKMNSLPVVSDSDDDFDSAESSLSSLNLIAKMLQSPASYELALQMLSSLTDPNKMGSKSVLKVSSKMLEVDSEVGDKVISLVVDSKLDPEETYSLRLLAMSCLSNAIVATNGGVSHILVDKLRPVLMKELKNANATPQLAYLCSKSLYALVQHNDFSEFYDVLQKAQVVGQARHATLARQTERCMKLMDSR